MQFGEALKVSRNNATVVEERVTESTIENINKAVSSPLPYATTPTTGADPLAY